MNAKAAAVLAAITATVGGGTYLALSGSHATVAEAVKSQGYTHAVYKGSGGEASASRATDLSQPLAWEQYGVGGDVTLWDASFFARYGVHWSSRFGEPYRSGYCAGAYTIDEPALTILVKREDNPLHMDAPRSWAYDRDEREDLRMIGRAGGGCASLAWQEYLLPLTVLPPGPTPTPPAPPTPEPTPPPTPEPTPEPTPDPDDPPNPTWRYGWAVRQVECVGGAPNSLCLDLRFHPAVVSTGEMVIEVR